MKYLLTFLLACLGICYTYAQGQWSPVGPFGGTIRCGISLGNDLLVGTNSGIYKSTDGGASYQPHSLKLPSGQVVDLFKDGNFLFACISEKGIYRSADNGVTWTLVLKGSFLRQDSFGQSKIEKVGSSLMVRNYSINDTLFFSSDAGANWTRREINNSLFYNVYARGNSLFTFSFHTLGVQDGLYRSDDLGQTWEFSAAGMPANTYIAQVVAYSDTLYALEKHIYRSVNGGINWTQVTTDTLPGGISGYAFVPEWVGVSGRTLFAQTGGNAQLKLATWKPGQSGWQNSSMGLPAQGNTNTFFNHAGKTYLARLEGYFFTTGSGQNWSAASVAGINNLPVGDVFAFGSSAIATQSPRILAGTDAATAWTTSNPPSILDEYDLFSITKIGSNYVVGFKDAFGVLETAFSSNQGSSWANSGIFDIGPEADFLVKGDTLVVYGSYGGTPTCFLANGSGAVLSTFSSGLFGFTFDDEARSMTVHKGDLYCVISGLFTSKSKIRKYDLPAATFWSLVKEKIDNEFFGATAIVSWQNNLYLGMLGGGVKVSTDDGNSWTDLSDGLDGAQVTQFHAFGNFLVMGSDQGVYLLESGHTTWEDLSTNLPVGDVSKVVSTDQYLWAWLEKGGVWRMVRNGNVAIDPKIQAVNFRVYPNPATDQLSLTFDTDRPAAFKILDLAGKVVETGLLQMERGTATLSLKKLPAGMYICQVSTGDQTFAAPFIKQ